MKYAVTILANSVKWMEGMDRFWPYHDGDEPFDVILIVEDRMFSLEDIKGFCENATHNAFKTARVVRGSFVTDWYKNILGLNETGLKFIDSYTMGMNILSHYFTLYGLGYDKCFFMDDDIFLIRKLDGIFEENVNVHCRDPFSPFADNSRTPGGIAALELQKIFQLESIPISNINTLKIQGGHRLWVKNGIHKTNYLNFLCQFFNNKILYEGWSKKLNEERGYKVPYWLIDQHFEAMYIRFILELWPEMVKFDNLANLEYGRKWPKYTRRPKTWMVHYANGVHKEKLYEDFCKAAPNWKDWRAEKDSTDYQMVDDKLIKWGWKSD